MVESIMWEILSMYPVVRYCALFGIFLYQKLIDSQVITPIKMDYIYSTYFHLKIMNDTWKKKA